MSEQILVEGPPISKDGADWMRLRRWINARIEEKRDVLENGGDAMVRGEIAAYRALIHAVEYDVPFIASNDYSSQGNLPT